MFEMSYDGRLRPGRRSWLSHLNRGRGRRLFAQRQLPSAVEQLEDRSLLSAIMVDTRFDIVDPNDSVNSFREAINQANSNPGPDTIRFDPSLSFSNILTDIGGVDDNGDAIENNLGEYVIDGDLVIDASDAALLRIGRPNYGVIKGAGSRLNHRVFKIEAGSTVEMSNIIVQRGEETGYGAGIWNAGNLTLRNSVVADHIQFEISSSFSGGILDYVVGGGGAIYNGPTGELHLINTTVGSVRLSADVVESLGIDSSDYPEDAADEYRSPQLLAGSIAQGLGSGIYNEGLLTLSDNSRVISNASNVGGTGIYNAGTAIITDSVVADNRLFGGQGLGEGGGIVNSDRALRGFTRSGSTGEILTRDEDVIPNGGNMTIINSTISNNRAIHGGGIFNTAEATLNLTNTTIANNLVDDTQIESTGGGLHNAGGNVVINGSTFMGNEAGDRLQGFGAAIYNRWGTIEIDSSTISGNTASSNGGGSGGGIFNAENSGTEGNSVLNISNSTIANNSAQAAGGIETFGNVTLSNSIVAANIAANAPDIRKNSGATLTSSGFNLIQSVSGFTFDTTQASDMIGVDPLLGPLGDYGGPTLTHGLTPLSPAINSSYTTLDGGRPEFDQRGKNRIVGSAADRGAFESEPPRTMRVDNLTDVVDGYYDAGELSLREAVLWAEAIPGADMIAFDQELIDEIRAMTTPAVITLTDTLSINSDLTIYGPGADLLTISGDDSHRVFQVESGVTAVIDGLMISDGAINADGAGIYNNGFLTLHEVSLTGNTSTLVNGSTANGGAIHNAGTLTINNSALYNNSGNNGGAIFGVGNAFITNTTISGNTANAGGGLYNTVGSTTITYSTIADNTASQLGGGIRQLSGELQIGSSLVAQNTAPAGNSFDIASNNTISRGNNLIGRGEGSGLSNGSDGNQVGNESAPLDPLIGPLRDLGGSTLAHGLLPTSPAIGTGNVSSMPMTDQRGVLRPVENTPDVGAYEFIPPVLPNPIIVDTASGIADGYYAAGEISLREAILFANSSSQHDAIVFDTALINLVHRPGVTTSTRSSFPGFDTSRAIDGKLNTSWFAGVGDAANLGGEPFYEVTFPEDVTVDRLTMRGNRQSANGFDIFEGRFDLFDAGGEMLYSKVVELPGANRDIDLDIPDTSGVRSIRFTSLSDQGGSPGFAELEVLGPAPDIQMFGNQLEITDDLTITGFGADRLTVNGSSLNRVFNIAAGIDVDISDLKIAGGNIFGGNGGGINNAGNLTLTNVQVSDNLAFAPGNGVGIYNTGTLTLTGSTVNDNFGDGSGGGIFNAGQLFASNSTLSSNGISFDGGGLYNAGGSSAELTHTTIALNNAPNGGGIFNASGGTVSLANTLIATNIGHDSGPDGVNNGTVNSQGGNLIGNGTDFTFTTASLDQVGTAGAVIDPLLTDLLPIRSTVPMHGLLPGSPATDAARTANGLSVDQRGVTRPMQSGYDIGAFEAEPFEWDGELIVDSLSDVLDADYSNGNLTLREAILWANYTNGNTLVERDGTFFDLIQFDDDLLAEVLASDSGVATITLRGKSLKITSDLLIAPFGSALDVDINRSDVLTIDADHSSRLLEVSPDATVEIKNLTFINGQIDDADGAGILNAGNLTVINSAVHGNTVTGSGNGGGIANLGGALVVQYSSIRDNQAGLGGGIYNDSTGSLMIKTTTIAGNTADINGIGSGGGLHNESPNATVIRSAIYENTAQGNGGGINLGDDAEITIENTTISTNTSALASGGGLHVGDGFAAVTNTTITLNESAQSGGGFQVDANGTIEIANTIVAGNLGSSRPDGSNAGFFRSMGGNLFGITTGFAPLDGTDITGDPMLSPLEDYGGATFTHQLAPASPAIDAGNPLFTPLVDQRGLPLVDVPDNQLSTDGDVDLVDIGAYEVQMLGSSTWQYRALDKSQFGPGDALVFGFGFDEGDPNSSVATDPYFLGFQFDTGPLTFGDIADGPFDSKFGGEIDADFSGKIGFDLGFYINSGSVDVGYDGELNYVIDQIGDTAAVSTFFEVDDGSLYTVSPKIGGYADLVLEIDADIEVVGCLVGCVEADLLNLHHSSNTELFAINRQMADDDGRPVFYVGANELGYVDEGDVVARDSKTGRIYDVNGVLITDGGSPVLDVGPLTPAFDGDVRVYDPLVFLFNQAKSLKEKLDAKKLADDYDKANRDHKDSLNKIDQLEADLARAKAQERMATSDEERDAARRRVEAIEGTDGKSGLLREAQDSRVKAQGDLDKVTDDIGKKSREEARKMAEEEAEKGSIKRPRVGLDFDFSGNAEGSLLGLQGDLKYVAGIGVAEASVNVGTMQITIPDVNLRDTTATENGKLSATTSTFPPLSDLDDKRQLAKLQVDTAGILGGLFKIPAGKFNVSAGPLSLDVTTVSYNIGPQLNVTQDVKSTPIERGLTYEFHPEGDEDTFVDVFVMRNNEWVDENGNVVSGPTPISSVAFEAGDRIEVTRQPGNTSPIMVTPTLSLDSRFSNDIGLDIDLDGVFEAFALNLSAFGESLIDVGPLIRHEHQLGRFDLGSVYERTFDLQTQQLQLDPFILFNQTMDGRTLATAFMAEPTSTANEAQANLPAVTAGQRAFVASDMKPQGVDGVYTVLDVEITGTAQLDADPAKALEVIDESLTVTPTGANSFRITGFTAEMLSRRSSAVFALMFSTGGSATVTTTRSGDMSMVAPAPDTDPGNMGGIDEGDLGQVGVSAVLNNDIDGDGVASPLSDGVLFSRHLAGFTGQALTEGALGAGATRTTPEEIANYIDGVLNQSYVVRSGDTFEMFSTLDFDGSGSLPNALGDGVLMTRYLAGFTGTALTDGAVTNNSARKTGEDVIRFIEVGRSTASGNNSNEFGQVVGRNGQDAFGLDGVLSPTGDATSGSSASAPADVNPAAIGASPEFAMLGAAPNGDEPVFDFTLNNLDSTVDFEEIYIDSVAPENLISRVAAGSPVDFGQEAYKSLINSGPGSRDLIRRTIADDASLSVTLGREEPIFVRAPDAAAYEYSVIQPGFTFESITIDPQVGGNILLPRQFDLYLFIDGEWQFSTQITEANPDHVGTNGFLSYEFPDGPVEQFRLYSDALPNEALHDESNQASPELQTTTGFILAGGTGVPTIRMTQLDARQLFHEPDPIQAVFPAQPGDTNPVTTSFELVRSGADVIPSIDGVAGEPIQMVSALSIQINGHDNVADTLVISSDGGPVRVPINFNGGFRQDSLVVSGAGVTLDLINRDTITEVEIVDIRGTGANTLILDVDVVQSNDPYNNTLRVIRGSDDTVEIGAGWQIVGTQVIDSVTYDLYFQAGATLLISQPGSTPSPVPLAASSYTANAPVGPHREAVFVTTMEIVDRHAESSLNTPRTLLPGSSDQARSFWAHRAQAIPPAPPTDVSMQTPMGANVGEALANADTDLADDETNDFSNNDHSVNREDEMASLEFDAVDAVFASFA